MTGHKGTRKIVAGEVHSIAERKPLRYAGDARLDFLARLYYLDAHFPGNLLSGLRIPGGASVSYDTPGQTVRLMDSQENYRAVFMRP